VLPAKRMQPESRQPAQYKLASLISGIHSGGHAQVAALEVGHLGNALDEKVFSIYDLCGLTSKNKGFFQAGFLEELFCTRRPEYLVLNLFELRALEPFTSSQEVEGVTITRYSQSEYHKTAWPHHVGLVLDRRFVSAYHFLQFSQSEGYPGGFALFKRNENFSCTDVEIYPEKVTASREHDPSTSASKVIDGDLATTWNAGDGHVQWLRFEFSKAQPIGRVRLWANQDREYSSKLRLRFWSAAGALEKSIEVPITVVDGDEIEIALQSPQLATRVEVESVRGHNWAAWREVRFLR